VTFKHADTSIKENFIIKTNYSLLYRSYMFRLKLSHHRTSTKNTRRKLFRNCCDIDNGLSQNYYHLQIEALGLEIYSEHGEIINHSNAR